MAQASSVGTKRPTTEVVGRFAERVVLAVPIVCCN